LVVGLFKRDVRGVIRVVGAGKEWVAAGAPSLVARGSIRDARPFSVAELLRRMKCS